MLMLRKNLFTMYEYEFGIYAIYCSVVDLMWLAVVRGPWKKRRFFFIAIYSKTEMTLSTILMRDMCSIKIVEFCLTD